VATGPGALAGNLSRCKEGMACFLPNCCEFGEQVECRGSMFNLPFQNEELDLIWSEGAIYNIGFECGINEWRKFLNTGGYIAVSEASWFTKERPAEIDEFWKDAYPEIETIPNKVVQMQKAGYIPVATFILPENCWTEHLTVKME
jgi:SAM-dependent methyltransferase